MIVHRFAQHRHGFVQQLVDHRLARLRNRAPPHRPTVRFLVVKAIPITFVHQHVPLVVVLDDLVVERPHRIRELQLDVGRNVTQTGPAVVTARRWRRIRNFEPWQDFLQRVLAVGHLEELPIGGHVDRNGAAPVRATLPNPTPVLAAVRVRVAISAVQQHVSAHPTAHDFVRIFEVDLFFHSKRMHDNRFKRLFRKWFRWMVVRPQNMTENLSVGFGSDRCTTLQSLPVVAGPRDRVTLGSRR
uniref:(northern house mosquito) hypothetical protein n=1 Tax=Culex pipiens TaxID=7175 RepID=A0A8D8MKJ0_CULPI